MELQHVHTTESETPAALATSQPPSNISETQGAYRIELLVPGVVSDSLDLSIEKGILSVRAEAHFAAPEGLTPIRREIGSVVFARKFSLPEHVDIDAISATLSDGVLVLELPKREAAQPRKIVIG